MKFYLLLVLFWMAFNTHIYPQGCVAIRGMSGCPGLSAGFVSFADKQWSLGLNYRYFRSFRHFRGDHEETNRVSDGTEVINWSHFVDWNISYQFNSRWYAVLTMPLVIHRRSSMYEHGGNPPSGLGDRHITRSWGLADVRLGGGWWLVDPGKHRPYNYALGLGVKAPTGDFNYRDLFYNQGPERNIDREEVVDQSIQPGDGGWGLALDLNGFHQISPKWMLAVNANYLLNPRGHNGVRTRTGSDFYSSPDQFAGRLGVNYQMPHWSVYLGGRVEGIPSSDLIGSSEGFRRPGYVVSVDPGFNFQFKQMQWNLNVPISLYRNRTQSFSDKKATTETGTYRHGDAAFADYLIQVGLTYRFPKKGSELPLGEIVLPDL